MKKRRFQHRKSSPVAITPQHPPKDSDKIVQIVLNVGRDLRPGPAPKNCLSPGDIQNLSEAAVNIWRARQRIVSGTAAKDVTPEMKNVLRRIDSALDRLNAIGLTLQEHTGEPYVPGMALNVISSQPNSALGSDRICETLKPTVFFRDVFVQAGDVVIEGPPSDGKKIEDTGKAQPT